MRRFYGTTRAAALATIACALGAGLAGPARAQSARSAATADPTALTFVLGNVEFLLLHEIAHLLIAEKDLPIIGPEENAADYIATLALLTEEPLDSSRGPRGHEYLVSAADAFGAAWRTGQSLGADVPYWSAHALSIQRYYQIVCLLYGSDPVAFARIPDAAGLPPERAQTCVDEYRRANRSIQWLLEHYGRRAADAPGAASEVVYEPAPTRVSMRILREVQSLRILERTLERLHERFTIERPIRLVLRSCGRAEAAWITASRELAICYELLDTLYLLGLGDRDDSLNDAAPRN